MIAKISSKPTFLSFLLTVLVLGLPISQAAAAPAEIKMAYVDLQKALELSRPGKKAKQSYEKEVTKAQKEIDKKKGEFQVLRKEFEKQRDSLNERARLSKEEQLLEMERDLKRSFKDSQEKLRRQNTILVGDLVQEIRKVVQAIGKERGLTIILERSAQSVLYADNSIDITDEVVKKFNKATKK